ncbi:MAG: hypothetical protein IMZ53_06835 [Thermoplasmata archaeon]|nr:hypothetical protein [Thermoplasmata archaeon]
MASPHRDRRVGDYQQPPFPADHIAVVNRPGPFEAKDIPQVKTFGKRLVEVIRPHRRPRKPTIVFRPIAIEESVRLVLTADPASRSSLTSRS